MPTRDLYVRLQEQLGRIIIGQQEPVSHMLAAVLAGGHVLLEGVPGTGKTLLVRSLARLLGLQFQRIQFTPDLLPSDITGTNVFDLKEGEFHFRHGPVFTNLLLADEINRTPPKVQSALLEAMEEKQVTVDGRRHPLPDPFIVFATQNPLEFQGTYPLPEAQLDRFMVKINLGYPSPDEEKEILRRYVDGPPLHDLEASGLQPLLPVAAGHASAPAAPAPEEGAPPPLAASPGSALPAENPQGSLLAAAQAAVNKVKVEDTVTGYILAIAAATREDRDLYLGASPRAAINLLAASRALAAMRGKEFVTPDEVKEMAPPVLRHRLVPAPEAEVEGISADHILEGILARVKVPR